jgi:multidrug resistance efflux pump
MSAKNWWLTLLVCLGVAAGVAAALVSGWLPGSPASGDVSSAAGEPVALVCSGYVDLEHGCTPLHALQPGRVARIAVREHDKVTAGAPLLYLEDDLARARVDEARAAVAAAQTQLADACTAPEHHRLRLAQQQLACEAGESALAVAQHNLEYKKQLKKNKLANPYQIAAAEELVKELKARWQLEQQKLAELRLRDPEREVRRAKAEADAAQARLKAAERSLADCILKAPQAGTVARVLVTPGEVTGIPPPQPALLFFPQEPRIVRAEVEQEFAGRLTLGRRVRVQDEVSGKNLGTGRVTRLSDWYLPRRTLSLDPTRATTGQTLECLVTLEAGHRPVRIGQRVRVTANYLHSAGQQSHE